MDSELFELPKHMPAMTLRGVVLFPKAMMPLRIFEERYKTMLADRLNEDRIFAIVGERENVSKEEEHLELPFGVATAGLIRVSKENPDGTSFVLLQGILGLSATDFPESMRYYERALSIPLYPNLSTDDQHHIIETIREVL